MKESYQLKETLGRGEGIFATRDIEAGETVMVGKIEKELKENHSHASQIAKDRYVFHAGLISKVNHSCDPNCGIKVNESGGHNFVAMHQISADEEITFDYAMRNYGVDYFPIECGCGSVICRGKISGWKNLPQERKEKYTGFVAGYLLELDSLIPAK